MKEKKLLYAIGWVNDEYIVEMDQSNNQVQTRSKRRMWLIAAVIALTLLLVGCATMFFWLQDRSIGQETYTQRFDSSGHYITPTEKTMDIVTLFGSGGSALQKAMAEWWDFRLNYPEAFELNLTEADYEKIPERYNFTYDCYTLEMTEKLESIAEKYHLKLLGTEISIQRYQYETALEGLGLTSLLRSDVPATMENGQGCVWLPQNFNFEFFVNLDGLDAHWAEDLYVNYSYVQAGYFPDFGTRTLDLEQIQQ